MEITTIANFRTIQNKNNHTQQVGIKQYPKPYTPAIQKNNSPNFGKFVLDDLFFWGKRQLNNAREAQKNAHIKSVQKSAHNDIKLLAKRLGISQFDAEKRYQEDLNIGGIKPSKYANNQVGLNKVVGYSLEKLELIKQVVVPVIKHQEAIKNGKPAPFEYPLPGGILLHGEPGTGKSHMAESLLEHLKIKSNEKDLKINTVIIDKPWEKGDTDENIYALWDTFENAQKASKNGEHTVIMVNNLDKIMNAQDAEILVNEVAFDTRHPAKDGITWIATTNDKSKMPEWMSDRNRIELEMPVGKLKSDAEASAALSHFITATDRKDKLDHDEMLDYLRQSKVPMVPGRLKEIIEKVNDNLEKIDKPKYETLFGQEFYTVGYREPIKNKHIKEIIEQYDEGEI